MKHTLAPLVFIMSLLVSQSIFPETIHGYKEWIDFNASGSVGEKSKLLYFLSLRDEIDLREIEFEGGYILVGLGYKYSPTYNFGLGYRRDAANTLSGAHPQDRTWEQFVWNIRNDKCLHLTSRSRCYQIKRQGETEKAHRLEQKITFKFPERFACKVTPVIYEDLHINLNRPSWGNHKLINENRFFVGLDFPTTKKTYLEVGYLNQYEFRRTENEMNHILFVSFNIDT